MRRRRLRDAAAALPIGALLIFTPPYMRVFDQDVELFGAPLLHVSLFALWFLGLFLSALLARALIAAEEEDQSPAESPDPDDRPADVER